MRTFLTVGLVALALGLSIVTVEARGGGHGGGGGGVVAVRGYTTARGTYVAPHYRTRADGVLSNNLSFRGSSYGVVTSAGAADVRMTSAVTGEVAAPSALIEQVEPAETWCESPKKRVGSGAGFCIIN